MVPRENRPYWTGQQKGLERYRFTWALDTTLGIIDPLADSDNTIYFDDDMNSEKRHYKQPFFYDQDGETKRVLSL